MKLSMLLLALLPLAAHAGLKWESTHKTVVYKQGSGVFRVDFPFRNTGKTNVKIANIQTGCACCTTGKVKKRDYAPGESGTLQMMVDVRGKDVPTAKSVIVELAGSTSVPLIVEVKTENGKTVSVPRWNIGLRK